MTLMQRPPNMTHPKNVKKKKIRKLIRWMTTSGSKLCKGVEALFFSQQNEHLSSWIWLIWASCLFVNVRRTILIIKVLNLFRDLALKCTSLRRLRIVWDDNTRPLIAFACLVVEVSNFPIISQMVKNDL